VANLERSPEPHSWRWLAVAFATVVAGLAFLPLVNWLPGGHAAPWYSTVLTEWTSGSAIVVGLALVLAIVSRRASGVWRDGALEPVSAWADRHAILFGLVLGGATLVL